jgi:SAM-dependent methyltransferase
VVRDRALMLILSEVMPHWRDAAIHEASPSDRGVSRILGKQTGGYVASHFFPSKSYGEIVHGYRNEQLENQTFGDACFDLVVSLDVMEHVFDPAGAYREIYRTLKPGGFYLHTFPIRKWQTEALVRRAELTPDGAVQHLATPEYHLSPSDESGSLVTCDYGYDIAQQIAKWASFDVRISRFCDEWHGLVGEYTEVIACVKRAS